MSKTLDCRGTLRHPLQVGRLIRLLGAAPSWGNSLLIYNQRPEATNVAGFHTWPKMRRYVRKGEKGNVILAPIVGRRQAETEELVEDEKTQHPREGRFTSA